LIAAAPIHAGALARLMIRARLRSFRNGLAARGSRRIPVLLTIAGLLMGLAYAFLFAQAFAKIVASVDFAGQTAALALVTMTLAFGSLTAKAASSDAVRAGSAENEFLLARPVSLAALVTARGIADAVTDPVGALFLFPVLLGAAVVWRLPPHAWLVAAAISSAVQITISTLAYATQLIVVRGVAPARRRTIWMSLRLVAVLALAATWMIGTWVLRIPADLAAKLSAVAGWANLGPGRLIAAPLAALVRGDAAAALLGLGALWLVAGAALAFAAAVARRAGMRGWEEAGAPWAEAAPAPSGRAAPVTAANKDLRLILRDRGQVLVLVAMPAIFVGVQIFGSAGWTWSTASLGRISCLAYSLALYMATIGPLTHMQAERRAFWILRTVPVPLTRLFAAKARAWSLVVGGAAAFAFVPLALVMPPAPLGAVLAAGILVVGGAVAMSFLAIAMAAGGADLSDEQTTAVGPATIYSFLLVGGLYNLVLTADTRARLAGLALYMFLTVVYWRAGVARAEICLDAEAVRTPQLRTSDAAALVLIYALVSRGVGLASTSAPQLALGLVVFHLVAVGVLGLVAAGWLRRVPAAPRRAGPFVSLAVGAGLGAACGAPLLGRNAGAVLEGGALPSVGGLAMVVALLVAQEMIFRGALQRALERDLEPLTSSVARARAAAGAITAAVAISAVALTPAPLTWHTIAVEVAVTAARGTTGRVGAAFVARLCVAVCAFL
jgi:hypothetical protein